MYNSMADHATCTQLQNWTSNECTNGDSNYDDLHYLHTSTGTSASAPEAVIAIAVLPISAKAHLSCLSYLPVL